MSSIIHSNQYKCQIMFYDNKSLQSCISNLIRSIVTFLSVVKLATMMITKNPPRYSYFRLKLGKDRWFWLLVFETIFMDHSCLKIDDQNRITLPSYLNRTLDGNAFFGCCTCFCKKEANCDDNFLVFKIHHESGLFSSLKPPI